MKIEHVKQGTPEWWQLKKGRVSGTRLGQLISGRKNRMIYDLLSETLDEFLIPDDFETEAMKFGTENEPIAREKYRKMVGMEFEEIGLMVSDFTDLHVASPDGITADHKDVLEIKCTMEGGIHIQRFFEGPESSYMPQIINYFAISDEVRRVHWVSYCPDRPEKEIVAHIFTLDTILEPATAKKPEVRMRDARDEARIEVLNLKVKLDLLEKEFTF